MDMVFSFQMTRSSSHTQACRKDTIAAPPLPRRPGRSTGMPCAGQDAAVFLLQPSASARLVSVIFLSIDFINRALCDGWP